MVRTDDTCISIVPIGIAFSARIFAIMVFQQARHRAVRAASYPWTVVRVKRRDINMAFPDSASVDGDIKPFARFLVEEMLEPEDAAFA